MESYSDNPTPVHQPPLRAGGSRPASMTLPEYDTADQDMGVTESGTDVDMQDAGSTFPNMLVDRA